jgi:hypothetical protein
MGRQRNRRSKNGFEADDNTSDSDPLYVTLPKAGLCVRQVDPDGNCLFRSFSSQYCGDDERHEEFRNACCDYMMKEDPEFFTEFLDDRSLIHYVNEMREDGTWGTQLEIVALCKRYHVNCVIFRPDGLHYRIECDGGSDPETRILMLSHHDEEHFNEVRFKESGRVLTSFNELELLLTELQDAPVRVSRRQARKRQLAPKLVSNQKILDL